MTAARTALVERLRAHLAHEPTTREQPMFGGVAVLVRDEMVVSAGKDGSLLVRVARADDPDLVALPGARRAEMGTGRSMGPGWITVAASALADDAGLTAWVARAMERNRAVTAP
ncbi:MAG: TfoX/Sxy family protein [Actinomycetaceae bacterium]